MAAKEDDGARRLFVFGFSLLLVGAARSEPCSSTGKPGSPQDLTLNISHPLFTVENVLQSGIVYQVSVSGRPGIVDYRLTAGSGCLFRGPGPPLVNWTAPTTQHNVTFRILYQIEGSPELLEVIKSYQISQDCEVELVARQNGSLSSDDLPEGPGCIVRIPPSQNKPGLLLTLNRLNVPCLQGSVRLLPGHRLCGKLQEIPHQDRTFHFPQGPPQLRTVGSPVFSVDYRHVDPCHNVTLRARNSSFQVTPVGSLDCTYRILLPYGYRLSYSIKIGKDYFPSFWERLSPDSSEVVEDCEGVALFVDDNSSPAWGHCALSGETLRELEATTESSSLLLRVTAKPLLLLYPTLSLRYEAVGKPGLTGDCPWPGVASQSVCLFLSTERQTWMGAEEDCSTKGGHLASITSQRDQDLIDNIIINSPDYRDENAYWVGGSDLRIEGDFRWSDSMPFKYTNWFPGWRGDINRQPNDDGLSGQDCLEIRRVFHRPGGAPLTTSHRWNDRDCSAKNYFICETLPNGEPMLSESELWRAECNKSLTLSLEEPVTSVTSPGFPDRYPDDTICYVTVTAPSAFNLLVEFEELVLENEPTCSYDFVEVSGANGSRKLCGDWSDRLKLLREVYIGPKVQIKFVSDYSHHFDGFKARISMGHAWPECGNDKLWMFNNSCYLVVSYPEVSWNTANKICKENKGDLASVHSDGEERFIVAKIRESVGYSTSAIYWLGARANGSHWLWHDETPLLFSDWSSVAGVPTLESCVGLQYTRPTAGSELQPGLYWSPQHCDMVGGYVCKKGLSTWKDLNETVVGREGQLSSPGFPDSYPPSLEVWTRLEGPPAHRLVLDLTVLDLEPQSNCLYDWVQVDDPPTRLCGHYDSDRLQQLHIVSTSNTAVVHFHSDYSISGSGFRLNWRAVDVSGCPIDTTTAKEGELVSPNYPHFLLSGLDCSTTILAPEGKRVWLKIMKWDVPVGSLEVDMGGGAGRLVPFSVPALLSDGVYVSAGERMQVTLRTGDSPVGRGYRAVYKTVMKIEEERVIQLENTTMGQLLHLNYPLGPPTDANLTLRLMAPLGYIVHLQFHQSPMSNGVQEMSGSENCSKNDNVVEVRDPYAEKNGSAWRVCAASLRSPLTFTSFLNSLRVKQIYSLELIGIRLNATVFVKADPDYRSKLKLYDLPVDSCFPNPCQNDGKCVTSKKGKHSCQCTGHFTGLLCGLTYCEVEPCQFGECSLSPTGFKCHCYPGYLGKTCDIQQRPCSSNPCDSRGDCVETNRTAFKCRCHAWWEGPRCERRMMHIPYKPLSQRMLQEPFWLGLITVFVVLGVLGLFWCGKRHFPEKLEKLLQEENERNRPYVGGSRCASVREPNPHQPLTSRNSLLGRLGIRKPSLPAAPTSRTFSLDDLLKPPTTPSPRKKRNNSTPVKKSSASEKKQILQQLVSPVVAQQEVIPLASNCKPNEPSTSSSAETSFTALPNRCAPEMSMKLEKKVTFARLLDKVSSEMSSGSELEMAPQTIVSPNSTSSNQGSDSRSSSETQLHVGGCELGGGGGRRGRKTASADSILAMFRNFPGVVGSAGVSPSTTPTGSTPREDLAGSDDSSTPMSSSSGIPDSPPLYTTLSNKTIIQVSVLDPLSAQKSSNSFQPSSLLQPPTILLEIPNKCLSPIREMPTPAPSPALTPVLSRAHPPMGLTLDPPNPMALLLPRTYPGPKEPAGPVIPVVRVEAASPGPGSPPPHRPHKPFLKDLDKPNSLDLPCPPPIITVTCSMTEGESDADSPATKPNTGGMCYLSPFSMCSRSDRTTSESNLSSSGYSSMASPGPSRCGSNNPLCPTDSDENHHIHMPRRPSPLLRAPSSEEKIVLRGRSDSETMSDDPQLESNDEGFGTDQLEEKIEEGELKSAKELEVFLEDCTERAKLIGLPSTGVKHCSSFDTGLENYRSKNRVKHCASVETGLDCYRITPPPVRHCGSADGNLNSKMVLLQLPSIVVEGESNGDKHISPMSSRSESPLSEKTGMSRFSPMFYGRMTDSDGLYDCGSSDCCKKKHSSRRKERRRSKSPTKISQILLEVPGKNGATEATGRGNSRGKPSPKRRVRPQVLSSTSSSSAESLNSIRDVTICLSPERLSERVSCDSRWSDATQKDLESGEETEDVTSQMLPQEGKEEPRSQKKISKMRTVGHQIRFLRRLEQSLKRNRARTTSPERPLLPSAEGEQRSVKRLSWLRSRGAASDGATVGAAMDHDWGSGFSMPNTD